MLDLSTKAFREGDSEISDVIFSGDDNTMYIKKYIYDESAPHNKREITEELTFTDNLDMDYQLEENGGVKAIIKSAIELDTITDEEWSEE